MAQPNIEQVAQSLNTLAEQLPVFANHPLINGVDQILRLLDARFDEAMATMDFYNRLAHARILNSSALLGHSPLYPAPLPGGVDILPEEFPATRGDFMDLEAPALTELLGRYGLAHQADLVAGRLVLAKHFGIPL
ncbi:hypothetical protein FRC06_008896 [Ceratobasidium sp. 370]|nr:hypothetical protein FRC06_008896 [Ceratobasidium sp. 370]